MFSPDLYIKERILPNGRQSDAEEHADVRQRGGPYIEQAAASSGFDLLTEQLGYSTMNLFLVIANQQAGYFFVKERGRDE